MKNRLMLLSGCAGLLLMPAMSVQAAPVEYVRVCSVYGSEFNYVPGTDICLNSTTGDARVRFAVDPTASTASAYVRSTLR